MRGVCCCVGTSYSNSTLYTHYTHYMHTIHTLLQKQALQEQIHQQRGELEQQTIALETTRSRLNEALAQVDAQSVVVAGGVGHMNGSLQVWGGNICVVCMSTLTVTVYNV